ncbi:N-acetyltransferase [Proteinivorax hydrogeniformans]|uniref:N-acetyltransferase n=1 Tax=Proteinivorax hydrogeniformans TaxID=1826727 RepID=A0AAU8HS29_9FIRM
MENIQFKQGTIEDSEIATMLIEMSAPSFFRALLGSDFRVLINKLYKTPSSIFSYQYCKFIMVDGRHAGLVLGYTGKGEFIRTFKSGLVILKHYKLYSPVVLIRSILAEKKFLKVEDDEFYLSNLAISPNFRKKGLGKKLLDYVYNESKNLGLKNIVLDVEADNEKAISLYQDIGMKKYEKVSATINKEKFSFYIMKQPIK